MRIVARQELENQLVEIEATHERRPGQGRLPPLPFGIFQRAQFALAEPGQSERLKRHQQTTHGRAWPARAFGEQCHAPELLGQGFDDEAGFAVRIGVQDKRGLVVLRPLKRRHSRRILSRAHRQPSRF